jgi:tetratricopeptide (TPR) repeat protein
LALASGSTPADEALRILDAALPENPRPPELLVRAELLAQLGRFDEAWPLARAANERLSALRESGEEFWLGQIAMLEGNHEEAARYFRRGFDFLESRGARNFLSGIGPTLARALCAQGRYDEAEPFARLGHELAADGDVWAQVIWRQAQALVEAGTGKHAEAERLAGEAVALAERTDALNLRGDASYDLGEVLAAAGKTEEAATALRQALERYEHKNNVPMVARTRARLAELLPSFTQADRG